MDERLGRIIWAHSMRLYARTYVSIARHLAAPGALGASAMNEIAICLSQLPTGHAGEHPEQEKIVREVQAHFPAISVSAWEAARAPLLEALLTAAAQIVALDLRVIGNAGSTMFSDWFEGELRNMAD